MAGVGVAVLLIVVGAVLASLIGTTGASVLLVRPLLRANNSRVDKAHVFVFFIFVVSNCGGLLGSYLSSSRACASGLNATKLRPCCCIRFATAEPSRIN